MRGDGRKWENETRKKERERERGMMDEIRRFVQLPTK
jgi:hypothetical protein